MLSTSHVLSAQKLYVAEYDLAFFKHREYMVRHLRKTKLQHPPGDEIYRNGNVSMVRAAHMYAWGQLCPLNADTITHVCRDRIWILMFCQQC